jgi:hypothetical protein
MIPPSSYIQKIASLVRKIEMSTLQLILDLSCDLGVKPPQFLRCEVEDDRQDGDQLFPHKWIFEEL